MANPTYSYTLTNGTTADATQVQQNFTDILNGVTDGTKDLSISALTCAGTVTLNGAVTLGNSTADDITITGYVASNVLPKTNATYDLGSSAQNWQALYLDDGATTGGTIYFDAGTSEYIQSNAAGTILTIAGFTSGVEIKGTTAANNTTAGYIGEYIDSTTSLANITTTDVVQDVTSISLTAGDWDVGGNVVAIKNGATLTSDREIVGAISLNSNSLTGTTSGQSQTAGVWDPNAAADDGHYVATLYRRVNVSSTTTVYLAVRAAFSAGNPQALGSIWARRVR